VIVDPDWGYAGYCTAECCDDSTEETCYDDNYEKSCVLVSQIICVSYFCT